VVRYPPDVPLGPDDWLAHARAAAPREGAWLAVAESFSGPVAVRLAAERPPGLVGVVLVATFVTPPVGRLTRWGARVLAPVAFRLRPPLRALRIWLTGGDAALARQVRDAVGTVRPAVLRARLRAVLQVDVRSALAACPVRVLYLRGVRDRLVPRRSGAEVAVHAPRIRVADLDAPHLVLQSAPAAALAAIRDWLG
jgi:pimeloyl-ACP methyl ester carboxylesterase